MKKSQGLLSLIVLSAVLYPVALPAKTVTIAVIDTGIDANNPHLCKMGHYNFVTNKPGLGDEHGHGTHVAGIIAKEAGDGPYCLVSMKYYSDANPGSVNLKNEIRALKWAIRIKVDIINFSGGGPEFNEEEYLLVKKALSQGIKLVFAAGNEHSDLDKECDYFPACYTKAITMVGNLRMIKDYSNMDGWDMIAKAFRLEQFPIKYVKSDTSNYGKRVSRWEVGTDVDSTLPGGKRGFMSGTSQATGVATGKIVKEMLSH